MGLSDAQRRVLEERLQAEGADYIAILGSYARNEETPESDIDILVNFSEPITLFDIVRIERELAEELGSSVELVTVRALSPYIKESVDRDKEVLLG